MIGRACSKFLTSRLIPLYAQSGERQRKKGVRYHSHSLDDGVNLMPSLGSFRLSLIKHDAMLDLSKTTWRVSWRRKTKGSEIKRMNSPSRGWSPVLPCNQALEGTLGHRGQRKGSCEHEEIRKVHDHRVQAHLVVQPTSLRVGQHDLDVSLYGL